MLSPTDPFSAAAGVPAADADVLAALQLRIARRADALSRRSGYAAEAARRAWLRAEMEVFEELEVADNAGRRAA